VKKIHTPVELIESAEEALQLLKDGNERYISGILNSRASYKADMDVLKEAQKPFAVIISCSDSRVVPEIFFDQKLGDIFIIRNAGNIVDTTTLGSMEYALEHLGSKLVVVCGHTRCGAIKAACSEGEFSPNISHIVNHIRPTLKRKSDMDKAVLDNVKAMIKRVKAEKVIKKLKIKVMGAYYNIQTGIVEWID